MGAQRMFSAQRPTANEIQNLSVEALLHTLNKLHSELKAAQGEARGGVPFSQDYKRAIAALDDFEEKQVQACEVIYEIAHKYQSMIPQSTVDVLLAPNGGPQPAASILTQDLLNLQTHQFQQCCDARRFDIVGVCFGAVMGGCIGAGIGCLAGGPVGSGVGAGVGTVLCGFAGYNAAQEDKVAVSEKNYRLELLASISIDLRRLQIAQLAFILPDVFKNQAALGHALSERIEKLQAEIKTLTRYLTDAQAELRNPYNTTPLDKGPPGRQEMSDNDYVPPAYTPSKPATR